MFIPYVVVLHPGFFVSIPSIFSARFLGFFKNWNRKFQNPWNSGSIYSQKTNSFDKKSPCPIHKSMTPRDFCRVYPHFLVVFNLLFLCHVKTVVFLPCHPLVNCPITMENHHANGKIHYFYGHGFNSKPLNNQRVKPDFPRDLSIFAIRAPHRRIPRDVPSPARGGWAPGRHTPASKKLCVDE